MSAEIGSPLSSRIQSAELAATIAIAATVHPS